MRVAACGLCSLMAMAAGAAASKEKPGPKKRALILLSASGLYLGLVNGLIAARISPWGTGKTLRVPFLPFALLRHARSRQT